MPGLADDLLSPLLAYDADTGSQLTETFYQTLASAAKAIKRLCVHESTVRYRTRRARGLLNLDLEHPKDRTTFSPAAFIRDHHPTGPSDHGSPVP